MVIWRERSGFKFCAAHKNRQGTACISGDSKKFQKSLSDFGQSGLACSVTSPYFSREACATGQVSQRDGGICVCRTLKNFT